MLLEALRKRHEEADNTWKDLILWGYQVSEKTATVPFTLAYRLEALHPVELGVLSFRVTYFDPKTNDLKLHAKLDLVPELQTRAYKHAITYEEGSTGITIGR